MPIRFLIHFDSVFEATSVFKAATKKPIAAPKQKPRALFHWLRFFCFYRLHDPHGHSGFYQFFVYKHAFTASMSGPNFSISGRRLDINDKCFFFFCNGIRWPLFFYLVYPSLSSTTKCESVYQGRNPSQWKEALVTPVLKKGDPSLKEN